MERRNRERSERHHTSNSRTTHEDIRYHGPNGAGRGGEPLSNEGYASLASTYGYHGSYYQIADHASHYQPADQGALQTFDQGSAIGPSHWQCVSSLNSRLRHLLMYLSFHVIYQVLWISSSSRTARSAQDLGALQVIQIQYGAV